MTLPSKAAEIVRIPFHGSEILAVGNDGRPHLFLRPIIESLGIDFSTQVRKLKAKSWACVGTMPTQLPNDTQTREHVVVDVRTFLMLLATIDENRVNEAARPTLVALQNEIADVVEAYFTKGGAINPAATEGQLATIIGQAEGQMQVLQLAQGLVDPTWLEGLARHTIARSQGIEPDIEPSTRPLTVGEYLQDNGVTGAALRSLSPKFGTKLKKLYIAKYKAEPGKSDRFVDGALRPVAVYTEAHRAMFDEVFVALVGKDKAA